ncbi:hermansky-pudlak syndrome protein [Anaeramoeba flamelloides]|uniref:Hermansky-pudlak syndrome protein n=1 Tax=Anaeramoeba flamelloides TaxID=1746091 RepID=A0ABQ8X771_9EUKA|nr:hermansky-pudlak syndrome protein [Anaeramoeba flamelloides]
MQDPNNENQEESEQLFGNELQFLVLYSRTGNPIYFTKQDNQIINLGPIATSQELFFHMYQQKFAYVCCGSTKFVFYNYSTLNFIAIGSKETVHLLKRLLITVKNLFFFRFGLDVMKKVLLDGVLSNGQSLISPLLDNLIRLSKTNQSFLVQANCFEFHKNVISQVEEILQDVLDSNEEIEMVIVFQDTKLIGYVHTENIEILNSKDIFLLIVYLQSLFYNSSDIKKRNKSSDQEEELKEEKNEKEIEKEKEREKEKKKDEEIINLPSQKEDEILKEENVVNLNITKSEKNDLKKKINNRIAKNEKKSSKKEEKCGDFGSEEKIEVGDINEEIDNENELQKNNKIKDFLEILFLRTKKKKKDREKYLIYSNKINKDTFILFINKFKEVLPENIENEKKKLRKSVEIFETEKKSKISFLPPLISIVSFEQKFPGLVHFILVDRLNNKIYSPSIDQGTKGGKLIKDLVWDLFSKSQNYLMKGCSSMVLKVNEWCYSYNLWFEDENQNVIPLPKKLPLDEIDDNKDFYESLSVKLGLGKKVHCWELFTLYLGIVPYEICIEFNWELYKDIYNRVIED